MNSKQLGRFLRKKRIVAGLTQGELAKSLGFSSSQFVSNIERGVAAIPAPRVQDYSRTIGVDNKELSKLVLDASNDKVVKKTKNKLNVQPEPQDPFIEAFVGAWETASDKDRECIKMVAEKILDIEYLD